MLRREVHSLSPLRDDPLPTPQAVSCSPDAIYLPPKHRVTPAPAAPPAPAHTTAAAVAAAAAAAAAAPAAAYPHHHYLPLTALAPHTPTAALAAAAPVGRDVSEISPEAALPRPALQQSALLEHAADVAALQERLAELFRASGVGDGSGVGGAGPAAAAAAASADGHHRLQQQQQQEQEHVLQRAILSVQDSLASAARNCEQAASPVASPEPLPPPPQAQQAPAVFPPLPALPAQPTAAAVAAATASPLLHEAPPAVARLPPPLSPSAAQAPTSPPLSGLPAPRAAAGMPIISPVMMHRAALMQPAAAAAAAPALAAPLAQTTPLVADVSLSGPLQFVTKKRPLIGAPLASPSVGGGGSAVSSAQLVTSLRDQRLQFVVLAFRGGVLDHDGTEAALAAADQHRAAGVIVVLPQGTTVSGAAQETILCSNVEIIYDSPALPVTLCKALDAVATAASLGYNEAGGK